MNKIQKNNLWKSFYISTLIALSLAVAKSTQAQTIDDKLPANKIRIDEKRPLQRIVVDTDENTPVNAYFSGADMAIIYKKYNGADMSNNTAINKEEWNHFKNFMMGVRLKRQNVQESFLLSVQDELVSHTASKIYIMNDGRQFIEKSRGSVVPLGRDALLEFMSNRIRALLNNKIYEKLFEDIVMLTWDINNDLNHLNDYTHSTDSILGDVQIIYIDNIKIDLKDYLTAKDIAEINKQIFDNPISNKIIERCKKRANSYLDSLDVNAEMMMLQMIPEIDKKQSLDLSEYKSITDVSCLANISIPTNIKLPDSVSNINLECRFHGVDTLDLTGYKNLKFVAIKSAKLPKIIKMPAGLKWLIVESTNPKNICTLDMSLVNLDNLEHFEIIGHGVTTSGGRSQKYKSGAGKLNKKWPGAKLVAQGRE